MCGIAGIYNFNKERVQISQLKLMTDELIHRGPDDDGFWMTPDETLGFGHRRLSIIDLTETGKQPMNYAEGRYTITYNGEIYNYVELRDWLQRFKYQFKSSSDTEVLLALYDFKKEKCLEYIDGMFSFAIWDSKENILFCARDRFGEKPFFYFNDNNSFVFASEIKALKKAVPSIVLNLEKLQHNITENYKPGVDETFFNNVKILPAAHFLEVRNGTLTIKKYWEIDLYKRTRYVRSSQYYEQFYEMFSRSVVRRLRSEVKTGSSLSGGLDSSAIVCCIQEIAKRKLNTFSARFKDHIHDEGKWIDEVVKFTAVDNFQVFPSGDNMVKEMQALIYTQEFPVASASVYAQWCVMRLAKEHNVRVLLDGQGADEYLAGYDNLKYFAIWELYRKGKFLRFNQELQYFKRNFGAGKSVGYKFLYDPLLHLIGKPRKIYDKGYTLRERLKYAVEQELPELLRYADRNSMAHSVEVRLPFLSQQLVEYVFSLPPELIYQMGNTKFVLREATKKILPPAIYSRTDKIGFAPPEKQWIKSDDFKAAIEHSNEIIHKSGLEKGSDEFRNFVAGNFISAFS